MPPVECIIIKSQISSVELDNVWKIDLKYIKNAINLHIITVIILQWLLWLYYSDYSDYITVITAIILQWLQWLQYSDYNTMITIQWLHNITVVACYSDNSLRQ